MVVDFPEPVGPQKSVNPVPLQTLKTSYRVLATLHASSIKEAISRLWAFLDEQGDELLVQSLQGIVAQHLIHIANNKKYCLYEALEVDQKVKKLFNKLSITVFMVVDFPEPVGPQKSVNPVPLQTLKTIGTKPSRISR
jgi:Tfp pilus assembly ATPase PilU